MQSRLLHPVQLSGDNMEKFEEEIDGMTVTNFKVNAIPRKHLREFKTYCKTECNDIYSIGIINLMNIKKKYEEIIPLLSHLQKQIDEIKNQIQLNKTIKTFGGKNE